MTRQYAQCLDVEAMQGVEKRQLQQWEEIGVEPPGADHNEGNSDLWLMQLRDGELFSSTYADHQGQGRGAR